MAIELGTVTAIVRERSKRVVIEVPAGGDPVGLFERETLTTDPDGNVLAVGGAPSTARRYSEIAAEIYNTPVGQITGEQLYGIVAAVGDAWRQQDIAAAAAQDE